MKKLAGRIDPAIFEEARRHHSLGAPKALDNAIVNYVTILAGEKLPPMSEPLEDSA